MTFRDNTIILIGLGTALIWWILESAIHVVVFSEGTFIQQLVSPDSHELWMRTLTLAVIIIFSICAQILFNRQKQAEEEVRDSHTELDQIFQTAADGMRVVDKDFNVLRVNDTFLELAGIRRDEVAGRKCYDVFSSPLCHTPGCPLTRILAGDEHVEEEVEKVRIDGKKVPCIVTATPFRKPGGELIGIVEDFKDITGHKQAERALRDAALRWQRTFDSTQDAICVLDAEQRILQCNRTMLGIAGAKNPDELDGRYCWEIIPGTKKPITGRPCLRMRESLKRETMELQIGARWFFIADDPMLDEAGVLVGAVHSVRDITERKQAEMKVAIIQKQIEFILGATKTGLDIIDSDFNVRYVDPEWQKVYGNPEGRKCYEYFMGRTEMCSGCGIPKALAGKTPFVSEEILVREGNRPIQVTTIPFQDENGEWLVAEVNVDITELKDAQEELKKHRDHLQELVEQRTAELTESNERLRQEITERKNAEIALRESENNLKAILESLQSALLIIDSKTHTIVDANSVAIRMIGAPREEIIGHVCHKYICPADVGKCPISDLKQTIDLSERILLTASGERVPILKSVTSKVISGHEYFIENIIDITEPKRIEGELKKSKLMLAEAMDMANLVSWEFDVPTGIFTFDDRFYALYATTAEREGGHQMPAEVYAREFVHPDDINMVAEEVNKAINTTNPQFVSQREHRIIRRDGEIRHIVMRYRITKDANGRTIKTYGANQDITGRKQAEEKLKRFNEELEEQVRQRTEQITASLQEKVLLLQEIHHRVKNNLQIIISLINLQMRKLKDPQLKQVMAETQNRIKAMALVHEKLYQSKDISSIDLYEYTRFLVSQLFAFYGVRSRKVTVNIDIGKIILDINIAIPLGLILNELVSNSLKHAFPDGSEGKREISIAIGKQNDTLSIRVMDNGIGMPADVDWRNTTTLGLGLVISLVEQLEGTIEKEPGKGTRFLITVRQAVGESGNRRGTYNPVPE
ncbi:MAG: PAS domain S-box protein [Methanoregula sp.]|nr:PAS domain S-box protein [Methanoregula sp.]